MSGTAVAASSVVLSNVAYVAGAVVVMIVVTTILVLRQRKPRSMEANVESFNRGLRALAPNEPQVRPKAAPTSPTTRTTPATPRPTGANGTGPVQIMSGRGRPPVEPDPG